MTSEKSLEKIHQYYADNNFSVDTPSYYSDAKVIFGVTGDNGSHAYSIDGGFAGISVDMLNAIASDAGYEYRVVNSSADIIPGKVAGYQKYVGSFGYNVDYVTTGKGVVMSDAYFTDRPLIVTNYSVAISSTDDLNGKKVGIVEGNKKLSEYLVNLGATVVPYKSSSEAMDAIGSGDVHFAAIDRTVALSNLTRGLSGLSTADIITDAPESEIGFLVPEGSSEMLAAINASIAKLKEDGTLDAIAEYYENNGYSVDAHSYFYDDSESSWWDKLMERFETNFLKNDRYEYIITGLGNTLKITALALVIGLFIGLLIAAVLSINAQTGRIKILAAICKLYVTVIRGTPVMVQLLLIYYVVFASATINPVLVASVAFGINSGAYITEIFRSGMNSVPKGQMEAARCLGLDTPTSMKSVVVPQALRNILPALGNESISLLKETSIAGFIGVIDLTRAADIIRGQTYDALVPLIVVALIYLVIVLFLQFLIRRLERRLNNAY
ncbi:MAG: transporter substrate-binding domain-containing protein [Thermoplasmata archaeon]|nr:transporter substrate-binding domain-containing protein [Thermoplasmata archaeon]